MSSRSLRHFTFAITAIATLASAAPPDPFHPDNSASAVAHSLQSGIADAKGDLAAGKLKVLGFSPPPDPELIARVEVLASHGVATGLLGDVVSKQLEAYVQGYNSVMTAAIDKQFGVNFSKTIAAEVAKRVAEKRPN